MLQNILLDENGVVKVSDFGVSRMLLHTLDVAQTVIGTPYYMYERVCDVGACGVDALSTCYLSLRFQVTRAHGRPAIRL